MMPASRAVALTLCPLLLGADVDGELDDWLAAEFATDAYTHIHNWTAEEISQ